MNGKNVSIFGLDFVFLARIAVALDQGYHWCFLAKVIQFIVMKKNKGSGAKTQAIPSAVEERPSDLMRGRGVLGSKWNFTSWRGSVPAFVTMRSAARHKNKVTR